MGNILSHSLNENHWDRLALASQLYGCHGGQPFKYKCHPLWCPLPK